MIRRRRGGTSARARSSARDAALAALVSLLPLSAHADPARALATSTAPTSLSSALRAVGNPPAFAASTTATAHRILLPDGPPLELHLSVFEATLELVTRSGAPLHAQLPLYSTPCRPIDPGSNEVRLQCNNGRIDAALVEVRGHRYLDLRELRGLPTRDGPDGPPRIPYAPEVFGFGAGCPGNTDAGRGECAFEAGDDAKARAALTAALQDPTTQAFAALRLGDLELRRNDPNRALIFYLDAGDQGMWGRLASERLCEITGNCFDDTLMTQFDSVGLPDTLRAELTMREIRMMVLLGRWGDAMGLLANQLDVSPGSCFDDTKVLCRRMTLAALRTPACPRAAALETYLRLPSFLSGPLAPELARAAAADSGELGAPEYGASLLAATSRISSRADLAGHARQAIALYQSAGDPYRAHVIWSWASTLLSTKELRTLPPDMPNGPPAAATVPPSLAATAGADLESDEATSAVAIARSTLARSRASVPDPPPQRKRR